MKPYFLLLVLLGPIVVFARFDLGFTKLNSFVRAQIKIAALEKYTECMSRNTEKLPDTVCKQIWANRFV